LLASDALVIGELSAEARAGLPRARVASPATSLRRRGFC